MDWIDLGDGFRKRLYPKYEDYLTIQGKKILRRPVFAKNYSNGLRNRLGKRLLRLKSQLDIPERGNVLCLGARAGGEVEAFINSGFFAIGIDVNPGEENRHVLHGDFHDLVFGKRTVDIVYTNSLDHALDMGKLMREVHRVLKVGGLFMTENKGGTKEPGFKGSKSDGYDCFEWLTLQHLINYITARGFELFHRYRGSGFTPWGIMFVKTP